MEEIFQGRIGDLQKGFELEPAKARRVQSASRKLQNHKERKVARNGLMKDKGLWSYDWRLALKELLRHQRSAASERPQKAAVQTYLLGKATKYFQVRADAILVPVVWSKSAFAAYVRDVAESKVTRLMQRLLYGEETTHNLVVQQILMRIFQDPSLRPHITVISLEPAFQFFYRHNLIPNARYLYNLMEELQLDITPELFNLMLGGAASQKDLHNFTYILRVMIQKGVEPNLGTWIALLRALRSGTARLRVVEIMRRVGLLDHPESIRGTVNQIIDIELARHVSSAKELSDLISRLDSNYGPSWLSISAGNKICHALGEAGFLSQSVEALQLMSERGCKPNNVTLHIFIGHCRRLRQPEHPLKILQLFRFAYRVQPKQAEYDALFMLAWTSRYLNVCRVVWRVACLEAAVSYRMQELVLRSLLRNTPEFPQTVTEHWIKLAGKVIVGIDLDFQKTTADTSRKDTAGEQIMEKLLIWAPNGDERNSSKELASIVLNRDLEAIKHYRLTSDFLDLLANALKVDQEWISEDVIKEKSADWILRHSTSVPYQRRRPLPSILSPSIVNTHMEIYFI